MRRDERDAKFADIERRYGYFAGMAPRDRTLWARALIERPDIRALEPFIYNLRVGTGIELPPTATQQERDIAWIETTKRIDVVGRANGQSTIIEVKPRAGASAIGQLIVYAALYNQDFPELRTGRRMIITDELAPNTREIFVQNGIEIIELGYEPEEQA